MKTFNFFCIYCPRTDSFYVGGSYGGRFADYPKLYRRKLDAQRVAVNLVMNGWSGIKRNDVLDIRKATVTV